MGYLDGILIMLAVLGPWVGYFLRSRLEQRRRRLLGLEEEQILLAAKKQAEAMLKESAFERESLALKTKQATEEWVQNRKKDLSETEKQLSLRETLINHQLDQLVCQEKALHETQQKLAEQIQLADSEREKLRRLAKERRAELEKIAHYTQEEAKTQLFREVHLEAEQEAAELSHRIIEKSRREAETQARKIISLAIQRYASDHAFETTTSTVSLPNEEMKGRIIGREGRNIRAFEAAIGITVLIDDTPNAVVLSGFDPVRREIAREAMRRLIIDGRIHPTRIEEVIQKVSQEMDESIIKTGEDALIRLKLSPAHPNVVSLLGKLRFRHSFSQNILSHSIEVAEIMGLMAAELHADTVIAKRVGLFHDIGKALSQDAEGSHALVGAQFLRQHGECEEVVDGVASHHEETPVQSLYGVLASAADAISASRPGARSETMTVYLKRLENLEKIGKSFHGVEKVYAVQAGRELRVIVQPDVISDQQSHNLARLISRKIEENLIYPGQIRVTVVRETRNVEFAK